MKENNKELPPPPPQLPDYQPFDLSYELREDTEGNFMKQPGPTVYWDEAWSCSPYRVYAEQTEEDEYIPLTFKDFVNFQKNPDPSDLIILDPENKNKYALLVLKNENKYTLRCQIDGVWKTISDNIDIKEYRRKILGYCRNFILDPKNENKYAVRCQIDGVWKTIFGNIDIKEYRRKILDIWTNVGRLISRTKPAAKPLAEVEDLLQALTNKVIHFIEGKNWEFDYIVPVPTRIPLYIAEKLAEKKSRPVCEAIKDEMPNDKMTYRSPKMGYQENRHEKMSYRYALAEDKFSLTQEAKHLTGKRILLLDDIHNTGVTLETITKKLKEGVNPSFIYACVCAHTRGEVVFQKNDLDDLAWMCNCPKDPPPPLEKKGASSVLPEEEANDLPF